MKIMSLLKHSVGLYISLLTLLLSSCDMFHDSMEDCGLYLTFKYDRNMKKTDLFAEQVKRVDVFFFDKDGILQEHLFAEGSILSNPGYRMDLTGLKRGDYQVLTWAGLCTDYELSFQEGVTRLEDFNLKLLSEAVLQNGVYSKSHADLWYGSTTIESNYWDNRTLLVDLIKDTNFFHISLQNDGAPLSEEQLRGYTFQIITGNGEYDYKNNPLTDQNLAYGPYNYTTDKNVGIVDINTMRILEDQSARLLIRTSDGKIVADLDLMYYIKEGSYKGEGDGLTFKDYLDYQDHFYIHFNIQNYIAVSITINGWTIWLQGTEI
ncbi:FimB/Mfa2 family fimbrial subunit [Bacteroides uniformis]|uniref:FimB/Mfa2 family fimbrial subunit n=1 Tax=Bacteroides uniformis TaxID=820 RepID=UPI002FEE3B0F